MLLHCPTNFDLRNKLFEFPSWSIEVPIVSELWAIETEKLGVPSCTETQ